MMGKKYLDRLRERSRLEYGAVERVTRQFEVDIWQITLARYPKLSLGYQRIMEIANLADEVRAEYRGAVVDGPEQDVYRDHMDNELRQIMRDQADRLIPFERRYPELGTPDYRGRKEKYEQH